MNNIPKGKAIFLDRDGTLNYDSAYVYKLGDLKVLDGAKEGLELLKNLGYKLIIITNQSGVKRGYYTIEDCNKFNDELEKQLGIKFDDIYICPHLSEENCECRKPKTLFIEKAIEKFNLDISQCYMIGDKESDIQMGINAGCKTVLIKNNQYESNISAEYEVDTILDFAKTLK